MGNECHSFLNPSNGWDLLSITPNAMILLLFHLGVFSEFFNYLCAFGTKSFARDEGFAGFDSKISYDEAGDFKQFGIIPK